MKGSDHRVGVDVRNIRRPLEYRDVVRIRPEHPVDGAGCVADRFVFRRRHGVVEAQRDEDKGHEGSAHSRTARQAILDHAKPERREESEAGHAHYGEASRDSDHVERKQQIVESAIRTGSHIPPPEVNHRPERQNGEHARHEQEASDPIAGGQVARAPLPKRDPATQQEENEPQDECESQKRARPATEPERSDPPPAGCRGQRPGREEQAARQPTQGDPPGPHREGRASTVSPQVREARGHETQRRHPCERRGLRGERRLDGWNVAVDDGPPPGAEEAEHIGEVGRRLIDATGIGELAMHSEIWEGHRPQDHAHHQPPEPQREEVRSPRPTSPPQAQERDGDGCQGEPENDRVVPGRHPLRGEPPAGEGKPTPGSGLQPPNPGEQYDRHEIRQQHLELEVVLGEVGR